MSEIYIFRHAQASYMAANYDKLSPKGEAQSAILGKHLVDKNIVFDQTYVGTLKRQKETLDIVSTCFNDNATGFLNPEVSALLNEHHGPRALKHSYEQLLKEDSQVQQWFQETQEDPTLTGKKTMTLFKYFMQKWVNGEIVVDHPEVESWDNFRKRVRKGLEIILEKTVQKSTVGIFTSGGVISAITAEALGLKDEGKVADLNNAVRNTSVSRFLYSNGTLNLLSFNEVPHLEKEMITFV
jgi:broad specificity phosphatase PhoE